ncbi:succinate dehydrogenase assembly factor 2 [Ferruginivarius sediminum]|uniref:FAD assembly factor SdhE n=1 Tax=Ferruginivarius sediminum TaxID=2661937 RepID=A0A369TF24_9PROT|nr:succinate dehydrogenase assembly factor 2 [Ferruginivarius sediminum]RDD63971.1 succinate dehydrogenase assembly factor 2 [Ferruginivarius sediminum]
MAEADLQTRRKRAYFMSWHRGTREMDLLIGGFADKHLAGLTEAQLERYETLLQVSDTDLYNWITGRAVPPDELDSDILRLLCNFRIDPVNG